MSTALLWEATRVMLPRCVRYDHGGAKLYGHIDLWVPPLEFLHRNGLKVAGYWPTSPAEFQRIASQHFAPERRIYFGPPPPAELRLNPLIAC